MSVELEYCLGLLVLWLGLIVLVIALFRSVDRCDLCGDVQNSCARGCGPFDQDKENDPCS